MVATIVATDGLDARQSSQNGTGLTERDEQLIGLRRPHCTMTREPLSVPLYQVDAFASHRFHGNPAAVVILPSYPSDRVLQAAAAENNLSETAFLVRSGRDYKIRWFTPKREVSLCGHATLASAAVVMERLEHRRTSVVFHSQTGPLHVLRCGSRYVMDLPAQPSSRIRQSRELSTALGVRPAELFQTPSEYLAVFATEKTVRNLRPDFTRVAELDRVAVIATAPSSGPYDFVSRCFGPALGIPEDPVTGSAHCVLAPYWARRLGRSKMRAFQASSRGGELTCTFTGDRVALEGNCVFYLEGTARI